MSFTSKRKTMLDAVTAVNTQSDWVPVWNWEDVTIHIYGISTGGVSIYGSNEDGTPANGLIIGSEQTADALVRPDEIPVKIMVELTTGDDGANGGVTAIMAGRIP